MPDFGSGLHTLVTATARDSQLPDPTPAGSGLRTRARELEMGRPLTLPFFRPHHRGGPGPSLAQELREGKPGASGRRKVTRSYRGAPGERQPGVQCMDSSGSMVT
nr:uncharacterized protein LOC110151037 isoform X2 [Odocoileus virginianus texanus]